MASKYPLGDRAIADGTARITRCWSYGSVHWNLSIDPPPDTPKARPGDLALATKPEARAALERWLSDVASGQRPYTIEAWGTFCSDVYQEVIAAQKRASA